MDHWYWYDKHNGQHIKSSNEYDIHKMKGIRLYDGDKKSDFDNGEITITNLRLIWSKDSLPNCLALDLQLIVLIEEDHGGLLSTSKLIMHLAQCPPNYPPGPVSYSENTHIKIGFCQGGMSVFNQEIKKALSSKDWDKISKNPPKPKNQPARAGILGIERAMQAKQDKTSSNINVAFEDLKNLMGYAKEMVTLSNNIATKIKEQGSSSDETTQFRSYLLSLGIEDPVTKDTVGSTSEYHCRLAHEISQALKGPIEEAGGVMLLTEVYCRINRARGLQLLSSEDVQNACEAMTKEKLPLRLHTFSSGVKVLQLTSIDDEQIIDLTVEAINSNSERGISASELAKDTGLPLLLAQARLVQAESCAKAVRDDSFEGLRFYPNLFFTREQY